MIYSLTKYIPEFLYSATDIVLFLIRIVIAAGLGAIIGLERTIKRKSVGVRTHCLIAAATATLMILSKYAFIDVGTVESKYDVSRMAAQVISGISFLCAAVIFKSKNGIKGISTAGGMWATAAIGLATGAGMYLVAVTLAAVILFIQFVLPIIHIDKKHKYNHRFTVELADDGVAYDDFFKFLAKFDAKVGVPSNLKREDGQLYFDVNARSSKPITEEDLNKYVIEHKNVFLVSFR